MNNIEITLTKIEADYVKTMLLNNTNKIQAICKKREEMKEFFRENTVLNGNIAIYSLKTLKGYYRTTKEKRSLQSLPHSMNWGMMRNGEFLTAKISESHKIGSACSLWQILEDQVDEKYFLSEKKTERLIKTI